MRTKRDDEPTTLIDIIERMHGLVFDLDASHHALCAVFNQVALTTSSLPAYASPVDNPGNFVWSTGEGAVLFNQSSVVGGALGANSGQLDVDFDSAGNMTFNVFTIQSQTIGVYTVLVQVLVGGSSGVLDASVGGYNTSMSLQLRVKVTGNGLPNTCVTPTFTRSFEAAYTYDPVTDEGEMFLYSATGGSTGSGWVTVPALPITGTACGSPTNQGATINSLLGFNGSGGGLKVDRLHVVTVPGPQGS